jgi:cellulose synthase/poly-beta-1,6-N-acetylglucosamine synthase-like glycosyltransferase
VEFLITSWYISLLILTIYYLVVFLPRTRRHEVSPPAQQEGVSIVIPVKNGSALLKRNLPSILRQQYYPFEIIVVNDHSDEHEKEKLVQLQAQFPQFTLIHSDQPPGKKHALMLGVASAQHPFILCTDVDCAPMGEHWISGMMKASLRPVRLPLTAPRRSGTKAEAKEIVIGYSPYEKRPGILNTMIRFDTVMTAIQYLSWAILAKPYMAVGRNLLFSKKVFEQLNPFASNLHIPYGDDDTLIQAASGKYSIGIALHPETFVQSVPATSWKQWFLQKHRHLSAGMHYSASMWWQTGLFGIALIAHWIVAAWLIACYYHLFLLVVLLAGLLVRWIVAGWWMKRLRDTALIPVYPLLEIGYTIYLIAMGGMTLINKRRTWN